MASNAALALLDIRDIDDLSHSQGFSILRQHLAGACEDRFCQDHSHDAILAARWVLVRDILHALLVPVVELFDKAVSIASVVTHARRFEDLEFAFSGDARSAFVWLQCFLAAEKEQDWCFTRGCPACVVSHSLDSEFTIRLLYAACLLSDVHYPFIIEGPTLPSFTSFLDCLQQAIEQDEIFGENFFEMMQPKAIATRDGIEDLIHQCLNLDTLLSQPASQVANGLEQHGDAVLVPLGGQPATRLKRSKMAKRQEKVRVETEYRIEEILSKCWDQLHPRPCEERHGMIPATTKSTPLVTVEEVAPA